MTTYSNRDDRTALGIDHDEHGCTIVAITPPVTAGENREAYVYGIPSGQLPSVLFDMTGGEATQAEQEVAQDFLDGAIANGATTEDLISSVRNTVLALCIHEEAQYAAEAPEVDEYDHLTLEQLRYEAKSLRASNHDLMNGREAVLNKLNAAQREVREVRQALRAIHGAISKLALEEDQADA
jgi:hypothetical protein